MDDAAAPPPGTLTRIDGFVQARLTRRFNVSAPTVWATLTGSASLAQWLAPGHIEPRAGGRIRLDFADSGTLIDSEVSAFEPGRLVAFSWSQADEPTRPVRFEVAADGSGSRLTLVVDTPNGEDPARACAGWEAHLAMLAAALAGAPIAFPFDRFKAAREAYREVASQL
jgi:uncharacterized protein YndB with AHSA1/START domain